MTIRHHPFDDLLMAFAAGTLDHGQHIAVATHLVSCAHCRDWVRLMENVGGAILTRLPPAAISGGAFARVEARLNERAQAETIATIPPATLDDVPGLPVFVRRYPSGPWRWIAPSVHLRPIQIPYAGGTRVFLLKSSPGAKMLEHTHTGIEMTCVLSGRFSHEGGSYGPGDFDLGDETMDHKVMVDPGEECICLVAMQGELRLNSLIGHMMQPFVRM